MAKLFPEIDARLREFVAAQRMFFVASAPLAGDGHVNLSPKGLDTLRVLGPRQLAYLDYVGSGAETIAHLRENGRITLMWCAFEGPPRILRMHGCGHVLEPGAPGFEGLRALFPASPRARSIIRVDVERIADSCGYGVPLLGYEGERTQLAEWCERKGDDGLIRYQRDNNARSLDGLPALRWV